MQTNNLQALLSADIPDPTDFATPDLRQLDANLRCTICSEFYDAPIILACGHCFCSLCIREHMIKEPECPICRKATTEAHFRLNPVLEEAVSAWKIARPVVLRLSRQGQQNVVDSKNNQTPRRVQTPTAMGRKRKRRGASESSGSDIVCVGGPSNSNASSDFVESSPLQAKNAMKLSRRQGHTEPSSDPREEELQPMQSGAFVECPICGRFVEYMCINIHMDGPGCGRKVISKAKKASNSNAKAEWSKLLGNNSRKDKEMGISDSDDTTERLPKVSYAVLKDKALKDLLLSQKLPIGGDRNAWITRHQRWVMLYNANLDKTGHRKIPSELRMELRKWEEDQKGRKHIIEDVAAHEVGCTQGRVQ
ncbi:hypothetical protein PAXRUDRAFT_826485 [Paxillus rubicundulus Ve08.2h10]|uniref:Postreplication repair E3 ubiquitin-protein ligase RAD18 n=1 Tax=Paxillus rubicundulus Ve08.2h10 TaxID=930991 RepID=A0A0D0E4B8_9AGAM|nr:hypothetical protein PAXRUDRAFT_826485 [Paxillus rubicundulus Ve08.2h10]